MNPQDDELIFADEISAPAEAPAPSEAPKEAWKVLVVDDEPQVHTVTKLVLRDLTFKGRKIEFCDAYSAAEAKKVLAENPDVCLALVDVVMEEDDAGLRLVEYIRDIMNNKAIRIILRTGQPGYAPEKDVIIDYDINDYKEKTEMSAQKLITCVITAIRNYEYIDALNKLTAELEQKVADRVAELDESNRKLLEDQEAGKKLQNKILPKPEKEIGPYLFSSRLFPSLVLSGDFIDYFSISSRYIGFYIADVSGHGMSSAIVTVLLKNFIDNKVEKYALLDDQTVDSPPESCHEIQEIALWIQLQHEVAVVDYQGHTQQGYQRTQNKRNGSLDALDKKNGQKHRHQRSRADYKRHIIHISQAEGRIFSREIDGATHQSQDKEQAFVLP